jgi:hypothetical protein
MIGFTRADRREEYRGWPNLDSHLTRFGSFDYLLPGLKTSEIE